MAYHTERFCTRAQSEPTTVSGKYEHVGTQTTRYTHVTTVVAARSVVVDVVACTISDRQPVARALGILNNSGGVEADRVEAGEAADSARVVRAIDA